MAPPTRSRGQATSARGTPEPPATSTLPADDAQQPRDESAALTLEQRIAAAEKRRDELQALRRLREIEAEIARLEEEEHDSAITISADGTPEVQVTATRKRSAPAAPATLHAKRTLRPKDPPEYRGKNLKEHREFARSCETAFKLLPQEFSLDGNRVTWAMQYLQGDPRELWYTHQERNFEASGTTPTWAYFKQYLLDLLSDPINRSLEAATAHAQAMQRKDQTVRAFATYLDVLEDQLTPYTEEQRVQHLFAKLKPELQRAITNYHQVPATREDLIALGSTLERNLRRAPPAQETRTHGTNSTHSSHKGKPREHFPKAKTSEPTRKSNDKSSITCYKCNKVGHYANECRSTNPNHVPVRVNETGKGQASLGTREK